jgi:hypothetical protein
LKKYQKQVIDVEATFERKLREPLQDAGRKYLQDKVQATSSVHDIDEAISKILEVVDKEYEEDGGDRGLFKMAGVDKEYVEKAIREMKDSFHNARDE